MNGDAQAGERHDDIFIGAVDMCGRHVMFRSRVVAYGRVPLRLKRRN